MLDRPPLRFRDRADAGRQLAAMLQERDWKRPVVFGIPRGGVAVAAEVAQVLNLELAVLVVRRLEAPYQSQLTVGAVTADGIVYINAELAREVGATETYLLTEKARQIREARRREQDFAAYQRPAARGRTAIVVDEGLVTGATAVAAVRSLRHSGAERVVVAVPAGPPKVLDRLRAEADEVVFVAKAPDFVSVDRLYGDFHHVESAEVLEVLEAVTGERRRRPRLSGISAAAGLVVSPA